MEFASAESYLLGTINETVSRRMPYRLERMRAFLRELGDPQTRYPSVQIAGTSGKGSTSTIVAAIESTAGKRVGLHTKPHLRSMTERARVDGIAISEERFGVLLEEMMTAIEATAAQHGRPTYYETLLALAFVHFAREAVDLAVVEVGLGGRLDGTNVLVPIVAAITSVGFDHMDVLGETLEEIAAEKAGIAKPGVPLVHALAPGAARDVLLEHARAAEAPIVDALARTRIEGVSLQRAGQRFRVATPVAAYEIVTPMLGAFQRRNTATAISVVETLPPAYGATPEEVERALATLTIPGRMELLAGHPSIVFDIAHNAEKAERLVQSLREQFDGRRFSFVVAIGSGKDAHEIIRTYARLPGTFIFTEFDAAGREAIKPQRLAAIAESLGTWGRAVFDPVEAIEIARRTTRPEDLIVVTGSTFIVAKLREWWLSIAA